MTRLSLRAVVATGVVVAAAASLVAVASAHTQACPLSGRALSVGTPQRTTLVPPGARTVLLCRYAGVPSQRLKKAVRITKHSTVLELAKLLDSLKPLPQGTTSCPSDDGSQVLAVFRGPRGTRQDRVLVQPGGCSKATGGGLNRTALSPPGPRLIRLLKKLTR